ncbi:hypothetical protein [Nitrosomonas sp.]|uniref:hypothetical protein n=1 Tax=Nitrosomonas sp. TaxID=42353 RepID=UPI0037C5E1B0
MNIIALDTSTEYCSLALWLNSSLISREVLAGQRHSELLLPMLQSRLTPHGPVYQSLADWVLASQDSDEHHRA